MCKPLKDTINGNDIAPPEPMLLDVFGDSQWVLFPELGEVSGVNAVKQEFDQSYHLSCHAIGVLAERVKMKGAIY